MVYGINPFFQRYLQANDLRRKWRPRRKRDFDRNFIWLSDKMDNSRDQV